MVVYFCNDLVIRKALLGVQGHQHNERLALIFLLTELDRAVAFNSPLRVRL
jgi:hypothetical protein